MKRNVRKSILAIFAALVVSSSMATTAFAQTVSSAQPEVLAATNQYGSMMLDTANYIMAPGNIYDVGITIKDTNGNTLSGGQVQGLFSSGKIKVSDSRTGSVVRLTQLSNGNFRVTGRTPGTCYIVYEGGGNHASVKIDVQNGVKQHGTAVRNTSYFTQNIGMPSSNTTPGTTTTPSTGTVSQQNALKKAQSYLRSSAFSYDRLVSQLEYEKFSNADAVYAVNNCGANWNEQALRKAKSYLNSSAFSYTRLIRQLEYEKFTNEQAVYAVNNCGADWNEQAVKKAQSYLNSSAFSRDRLIGQLEYEGFTNEQAVYAVNQVGL